MSFAILGLGTGLPRFSVDQQESARIAGALCCSREEERRLLRILYRKTRIERRYSVMLDETGGTPTNDFYNLPVSNEDRGPSTSARMQFYEKYASQISVRASRQALESSGLPPQEITHLITVSCTGFFAPGFDIALISELGLPADVARLNVGFMGCHAVLNALRIADSVVRGDPSARVLISSLELCSLHFQYGWNPDQVVSNALFADGAGSIVGASSQQYPEAIRVQATGSRLLPDSLDAMTWRIGDHGFVMTLSAQVPSLIQSHLPGWLAEWLQEHQLEKSDVRVWAIHPGGPRILDACQSALELPDEAVRVSRGILSNYGNMSSATMVFILKKLFEKNLPGPCLALGFGPGLSIEAVLFG